jgi:hypothetical protein
VSWSPLPCTDGLSKALLEEFNARLAKVPPQTELAARALIQRSALMDMVLERERELRMALDSVRLEGVDSPIEPTPALITLLNHPAELVLLRAALT